MSERTSGAGNFGAGLSRRSMIKRIGAGTALVWAAPSILSTSSGSAMGSPLPCPSSGCSKNGICALFANCGTNNNGRCSCFFTTDGSTFCADTDFICGNQICETCADCPDGWACVETCCANKVCAPPCTNAPAAAVTAGGRGSLTG